MTEHNPARIDVVFLIVCAARHIHLADIVFREPCQKLLLRFHAPEILPYGVNAAQPFQILHYRIIHGNDMILRLQPDVIP